MSVMEVIAIDDDEDEEIEVVFADVPPPNKINQLRLQIDLLQAFSQSSEPIPVEYDKFHKCAKKVRANVSDEIILAAWKRAINKQLCGMIEKSTRPPNKITVNTVSVVDLTEANSGEVFASSSLEPKTQVKKPQNGSENKPTSPPTAVPVALIANPKYHQNMDNQILSSSLIVSNETISDIDVSLVDELENVTNSLVKIINNSIQPSEGSNNNFISEENSNSNSISSDVLSSKDCLIYPELNTSSDVLTYSETNSLCDAFDWQIFNNGNEESKESGDSDQSIKKQRKRKSQDKDTILLDFPAVNNASSSLEGESAKMSKLNTTRKSRRSNKKISLTEAELKLFREEQKKQKLREKRDLVSKQLERVHDRLVDVLIPKYFKDISKNN